MKARQAKMGSERPQSPSRASSRSFCMRALNQRDCACNIDPPASSYVIMRRAGPYRGENSGPGKDDRGELDTETRN